MRILANFIASGLLAAWLILAATLSIQNITPVSLKFLTFRSVDIPFGVLLTFSVGVGLLLGAFAPVLLAGRDR